MSDKLQKGEEERIPLFKLREIVRGHEPDCGCVVCNALLWKEDEVNRRRRTAKETLARQREWEQRKEYESE